MINLKSLASNANLRNNINNNKNKKQNKKGGLENRRKEKQCHYYSQEQFASVFRIPNMYN